MKKIILFLLLQVLLFCFFYGGQALYHNFSKSSKGRNVVITIKSIIPGTDNLILDPTTDPVDVYKGKDVIWTIDPSSNVDSFRIEIKNNYPQIFHPSYKPPIKHAKSSKGHVDTIHGNGTIYGYSIIWKKPGDTTQHRFDPKLAVRSSTFKMGELLLKILTVIMFLFSFAIFRTNKK